MSTTPKTSTRLPARAARGTKVDAAIRARVAAAAPKAQHPIVADFAKAMAKAKPAAKAKQQPKAPAAAKTKGKPAAPAFADDKAPRAGSKAERLVAMIGRPQGATIEQICKAFTWLPHTARAALSAGGLGKRGIKVAAEKVDGVRVYRLA